MITDILGNELKENDLVCTKVTEMVIGRVVKISEGGQIGRVQGNQIMDIPTDILILVEVRRRLPIGSTMIDVVKAFEPKVNKPN